MIVKLFKWTGNFTLLFRSTNCFYNFENLSSIPVTCFISAKKRKKMLFQFITNDDHNLEKFCKSKNLLHRFISCSYTVLRLHKDIFNNLSTNQISGLNNSSNLFLKIVKKTDSKGKFNIITFDCTKTPNYFFCKWENTSFYNNKLSCSRNLRRRIESSIKI